MTRNHIGMPTRKCFLDAVMVLKTLDHPKLIFGPGVARVVPSDKTSRVVSAKFLERVLKGHYRNFSVDSWTSHHSDTTITVVLRWRLIWHADRDAAWWQPTRTQRYQIFFWHTVPKTVMVDAFRACTPKNFRWGELPPIPCLCTYTSNYLRVVHSITLHVIETNYTYTNQEEKCAGSGRKHSSRNTRGIENEIGISCNNVWRILNSNYTHPCHSQWVSLLAERDFKHHLAFSQWYM